MSAIFQNILSHPEIAAIWSDTGRTSFYLEFERALALVQADLGIIPREAADGIAEFCSDVSNVDLEELRVQTEKIGYPVLGLIKQIVHHVNAKTPGYGEWAHWGATTQVLIYPQPSVINASQWVPLTYLAAYISYARRTLLILPPSSNSAKRWTSSPPHSMRSSPISAISQISTKPHPWPHEATSSRQFP